MIPRTVQQQFKRSTSTFKYVQGQYNQHDPKIREYFYYVDHNGMLFLDDARMKNFTSCFKDKKFLNFFFTRIRRTTPQPSSPHLHKLFRYTSHCGRERNYIRVEATPFVYSNFIDTSHLELNYTGSSRTFNAASLYEGSDGRLYHEFDHKEVNFALIKSQVADGLFHSIVYDGDSRAVAFREGERVIELDYRVKSSVEAAISEGRGVLS